MRVQQSARDGFARASVWQLTRGCKSYGQAERPFSTGTIHVLRRFHTRPINLVVFGGSLGPSRSRDALSRGGLPAYMLSAVIPSAHSYPAMRLAPQPDH